MNVVFNQVVFKIDSGVKSSGWLCVVLVCVGVGCAKQRKYSEEKTPGG